MCGSTDIGQGSDSILAYIVAEVLGIDPFDIRVVTADTDLTPVDLGSYSSRVTLMTGNAAIQAAERARELLTIAVAEKLNVPIENISFAERRAFDVENPETGVSFAEAVVLAESKFGTIGTVGSIPSILVVKNNFRNVPETAVTDWIFMSPGNLDPSQFFFKKA